MTGEPGEALSFIPGLAHSPAALSLPERNHRHGIDPRNQTHNHHRTHLERAPDEAGRPTSDKCNGGNEHAG